MKDMDIQEFLSTEIPVSTPNEHGVYCRDCQTWVTIVDTPKLKMSVIVARSEQGIFALLFHFALLFCPQLFLCVKFYP